MLRGWRDGGQVKQAYASSGTQLQLLERAHRVASFDGAVTARAGPSFPEPFARAGDLRDPARILAAARETGILDFDEPIALMMIAVLHFIPDDTAAYDAVAQLLHALPAGSHLALSHASYDLLDDDTTAKLASVPAGDFTPGTREQIVRFFDGLDLAVPGLQIISEWCPDPTDARPDPSEVPMFGAVARRP
jgi:hypothetical protein